MTTATDRYKPIIIILKAALDASLDPVCLVNTQNQLVWMNMPMKNFLGLRPRDLEAGAVFCDHVKLSACRQHCQVLDVLRTGTALRLDETPAESRGQKLRLSMKASPFYDGGATRGTRPIGAIITLRDSTAEILLQAKYHKLLELVKARDERIAELEESVRVVQKTLRGARANSAGRIGGQD